MATIEEINNKDGISYRVQIRKKGVNIYKTFYNKEDANLFVFYKENLIQNMDNFDIKLEDRVTFNQLVELKKRHQKTEDTRGISELNIVLKKFSVFFGEDKNFKEITYDNWVSFANYLLTLEVAKGNHTRKKPMSMATLRRYFATTSGVISYCQKLGLNIENLPLKVIQTYITPKLIPPVSFKRKKELCEKVSNMFTN